MGSGVRGARTAALSPASGVRAMGGEVDPTITAPAPLPYVPPRPDFESDAGLTRVGTPEPALLALARGEDRPRTRRLLWFGVGLIVGGLSVWSATSDVPASVYRARIWAATALRSLRAHAEDAAPPAAAAPVPSVLSPAVPTAGPGPMKDAPLPVAAPTSPGAPALSHAPGPR